MKLNIQWVLTASLLAGLASANSAFARGQTYNMSLLLCKGVATIPETEENSNGVPTEFVTINDITVVAVDNFEETVIERPDGSKMIDAIAIIHRKEVRPSDPELDARYTDFHVLEGSATLSGDQNEKLQFLGESNYFRLSIDSDLTTPTASKVLFQTRGDYDFEDFINVTTAECIDPNAGTESSLRN